MGIAYERIQTPKGHAVERTLTSGAVNADDVRGMLAKVSANGELFGRPMMSVIEADTTYSPEARMLVRSFDMSGAGATASALVVKSAAQRIVLGFMLRMNLNGGSANLKVFGKEVDALAWLDEQLSQKKQ